MNKIEQSLRELVISDEDRLNRRFIHEILREDTMVYSVFCEISRLQKWEDCIKEN